MQRGNSMEILDKRRHNKKYMMKATECTSYQQSNQLIGFDCIIANISQSGLCLHATEALKNGQEITIKNNLLPYPQNATVRWSKEYNGLYYIYGLEFLEQQNVSPE